ncbi:hypothetical protein VTP01DRAFT_8081 [Rhizomucor pusillus]|uniref:uncharacterized protein n=1 Tax=Rhizomucor pusillus TaxID=4840 RepID=UPI003741EB65
MLTPGIRQQFEKLMRQEWAFLAPSWPWRQKEKYHQTKKLEKSGFRTPVCIDINQMTVFVSDAEHCGEHNDGSMLSQIDLSRAVSKYDVIGLDGGYTLYIGRIVQKNTHLTENNMVYPIRKDRGKDLLAEEIQFNNMFGGFRSMVESVFGEIGHTFEQFNNKNVIRVSDMETFTLQIKLAAVLLNIKRFVSLGKLELASHHTLWIQQGFDFGSSQDPVFGGVDMPVSLGTLLDNADTIGNLQKEFLGLSISEIDSLDISENMDDGSVYEVESKSKKINDQIFEENAELLNDVAYVDYTIGGLNPRFSWSDMSTAFCDSMLFWCLTCASLMRKPEEIDDLLRARFAMVTDELSGVIIKYVYSGLCGECLAVFPIDKLQRALREFKVEAKDFKAAYIAIKVSFQQQLPLETVIRCVREVIRLLEESTIILHDIDISVDCAFISTRAIIKDYLSKLGVTESDIAVKVKDVGLNCISWRRYTTSVPPVILRTKIYNKFVQMLESTDIRSSLGSQLANLIMDPCSRFAQKLRSFSGSGMSRIEITFYSSTVYDAAEYKLIIRQTLDCFSLFTSVIPAYLRTAIGGTRSLERNTE